MSDPISKSSITEELFELVLDPDSRFIDFHNRLQVYLQSDYIGSMKSKNGISLFEAIVINNRNDLLVSPFFLGIWREMMNMSVVKRESYKNKGLCQEILEFDEWEKSLSEIHKYCRICKIEDVKRMVLQNALVLNRKDMYGYGMVYWAFVSGSVPMVDYVLQANVFESPNNFDSIFVVVRRLKHDHLLSKLKQISGKKSESLISEVASYDHGDCYSCKNLVKVPSFVKQASLLQIKDLIQTGKLDPFSKDSFGKNLLLKAVELNRMDLVEYLLTLEVLFTHKDLRHRNVFHIAAQNNNASMITLMYENISKKAGTMDTSMLVNQKDKYIGSELCMLLKGKQREKQTWYFVEVLRGLSHIFLQKSKQGGVFDVSKYGEVVLSGIGEGPTQEDKDKVSEIYENRKAAQMGFKKDQTPLHIAAFNGAVDVVKVLLKYQALVDCRDCFGMTPLHYAAVKGHKEMCDLLLEAQADPTFQDNFGKTPIKAAEENGHLHIPKFISAAKYFKVNKASLIHV